MSTTQQTVTELLDALAECRRDLGRYAAEVWQDHDFGEGSTLLSDLEIRLPDGSTGILVGYTAQRWHRSEAGQSDEAQSDEAGQSDDVDFQLMIKVTAEGFVVRSGLEALLIAASGDFPAGSHVLYRNQSEVLDLAAALVAARAHVAAFRELDPGLPALGFAART